MIIRLISPLVLMGSISLWAATAAVAGAPPPSWTQERVLECDEGTVHTYLTPAGFGTPFHVVGTNDVIIPKYVEVVLPTGEGPYVTLDVPGFKASNKHAVHCWYVDPIGLEVEFWGTRR
ncbi:hypothetical protein [Ornithinimicrobium cryptoxanthini]|uniref:Uncharacterized protein n=1 Tax=Ornithinimicrobium cryptoxanthini TaxID=2934161 RepID=A0ABY4YHH1_9MICO|nr:hypothetical protein [Ornithinimicrobium cryptoxanthini]USQ76082.1 hypothetical protein NF557_16045 [Ornithinimicrobium cryptoxanthini]